jgi:hypothetical protein
MIIPPVHLNNSTRKEHKMTKIKSWLFRVIIAGAGGLFVYSWMQWWWSAYIDNLNDYVYIRPWGLFGDVGEMQALIEDAFMPSWFPILMWTVFAVLLGLILASLISTFIGNKKVINLFGKIRMSLPTLVIGFTGVALVITMAISLIMMIVNMQQYWDCPLIGMVYVNFGEHYWANVYTKLYPAYYIEWGIGVLFIILALVRRFFFTKEQNKEA